MIPVAYQRGVHIPAHDLWLDPHDPRPRAFVSHAHSDHIGRHAEIIASAGTARLMGERLPGTRIEHVLDFGAPAQIDGMQITLLPAGHILGSAQLLLETGEGSLLYTGDFKLRAGLSAEPTQWRHAETLIMETTYGLPRYRFPPTATVIAQMIEFCREALDEGAVPVLFGYSLGKAQEILCALADAGLQPMLHGAVFNMTRIYRQLRPDFPECEKYRAGHTAGKVLICPPSAAGSAMLNKIPNRRTAVLTGWALDKNASYRYRCDAAFPLSDHADYDDLIRYVELVQPERVLTLHGFAAQFASDLRERGVEAWALSAENQLELQLHSRRLPAPATPRAEEDIPHPDSPFGQFALVAGRIGATAAKLKKIELLATYLSGLDEAELPSAARYFTGSPFAQTDSRVLQTGWAIIRRALLAASGISEQELRDLSMRHSDAGKTALDALRNRTRPEPFTFPDADSFFAALEKAGGPVARTDLLRDRFTRLSPLEGSWLVRILTSDLRIGLKEGLVEEAIATAFAVPLSEVKEAGMLLGDVGEVALLAKRQTLATASLRVFRPIKCMLASPEPNAEAIWKRLTVGEESAVSSWVEDKFDGIRAQLHRAGPRVEIYSRDLRVVTAQFEEIANAARHLEEDVILDGEVVAFEHGRRLTFFDLQKRLGRKGGDLFLGKDIPVIFVAFDLLWHQGRSLLKEPLEQRRAKLEALKFPPALQCVPVFRVDSAAAIDQAFDASRDRGNEGLIVKDAQSIYTPGRRGLAWLKLKKELATLDVVVVGAETGHGRRSQVLSDYTFAVRDEATGTLLTIGKAYSGLTDEEIEQLTEHFEKRTLHRTGRYREVVPDVVLEIAFDSIQPSDRHSSGLALRFPRIKQIRRDKTAEMIDTLAHARSLVVSSTLP